MAERSSLFCPRCRNRALEPCAHGGYDLDMCMTCFGLWCEAADWDTAGLGLPPGRQDDAPPPKETLEFYQPDTSPDFRSDDWACPACAVPLRLWSVRQVDELMLDVCDECGGVWFDRNEWENLGAVRAYQSQRSGIERPTTWGEWFFQLLFDLPIEFNIAPRRLPLLTLGIILVCVAAFLAVPQTMYPELELAPGALRLGRIHTFITHQFLHAGWLHLLGNMYLLYILGDNVEDVIGRLGFLFFYLFCGVVAGVAYLMFTPMAGPMIGASGAISGVIASYLVLFRRSRLSFMVIFKQFKPPAAVWIGFWLFIQMIAAWFDRDSMLGVAWFAHLGGFFAGLLVILPLRHRLIARYPLLSLLDSRRIHA